MKRNHLKVMAMAMLLTGSLAITTSCDNGDDPIPAVVTPVGIAANPSNFQGEVKSGEIVTLDATKTYKITGAVVVRNGGQLVIPAGTKFDATGGTSAYVTVEQGGKIFSNGTSDKPVVFTSSAAKPGSWGGIVICGKAPINKGATAASEVGNATYGGTDAADNSGSITFTRIEYAGAIFTGEKEFNGLSLFGVGSGTTLSNISILNGSDDAIEFFGGTASASNLILVGNEDDMLDWTEGWKGTAANVYGKRRADGTGNRGIEGDNNSNNNDADPRSNPTIKNATFIGGASGEGDGIKLRVGTYATIDNVVLSGWKTGINLEHDATLAYFLGKTKITNVKMDGVATDITAKSTAGVSVTVLANTFTANASATGAGNVTATPTWAGTWAGL